MTDRGPEEVPGAAPSPPVCAYHPERSAGAECRRCGRAICPDCMYEASVGWQCLPCIKEGARRSPQVRWRARPVGRLGSTPMTPVTAVLVVLNVIAYIWEQTDPIKNETRFVMWSNGVHYDGQWYRVLTSAFLHENFTHILLNMLTLLVLGPAVEAELGRVRYAVLYLLAAAGGSVGYYLLADPAIPVLGASGAIFGLMGAYYVLARRRGWQLQTITGFLAINVIFTFVTPNVAWQDHLGGLITGVMVAWGMVAGHGRSVAGRGRSVAAPSGLRGSLTAARAELLRLAAVTVVACAAFVFLLQLQPQPI